MADGTITYDYPVIEQCVAMMMKKADEIDNQATLLGRDVKTIMQDWVGETANSYEARSTNLQAGLDEHRQNLLNLRQKVSDAAAAMEAADKGGAKGIA
ncbi:WXG100 family type VII secretion target [Amycolatopsis regifaucium]|uniref:ESAT-6-like protein n=1 Tax=Amycolatopsis regifaucium TaxID=546365 RepID=A0A154M8D6_9PSEU|nr:WXG100 family type VII secretion target [Amycolatopsis regifaucium]KZB80806.1 hypothetical protein AVL48_37895 [Amycolatopsis regifaucium]OKA03133.1 hypothetical protein ATP06_0237760 [Amycolatopsis regifaucium]